MQIFLGRRTPLPNEPDVVALWVEDDYRHLPAKGLAFYQYALEHYDFDWLFKCDDDTWLALDRLESLCDGRYDLVGDMSLADRGFPSGGAGYLMSRALVEGIVAHGGRVPAVGAEDVIFGRLARELGARVHATPRLFLSHAPAPHRLNDQVSAHWCSPGRMHGIEALFHDEPVAVYDAVHPHWRDELLFLPGAVSCAAPAAVPGATSCRTGFSRCSGMTGRRKLWKKRQRIFPRSVLPDPCRRQPAASFSGVRVLTGMASIPCSSHPSAVVRHEEGR